MSFKSSWRQATTTLRSAVRRSLSTRRPSRELARLGLLTRALDVRLESADGFGDDVGGSGDQRSCCLDANVDPSKRDGAEPVRVRLLTLFRPIRSMGDLVSSVDQLGGVSFEVAYRLARTLLD